MFKPYFDTRLFLDNSTYPFFRTIFQAKTEEEAKALMLKKYECSGYRAPVVKITAFQIRA